MQPFLCSDNSPLVSLMSVENMYLATEIFSDLCYITHMPTIKVHNKLVRDNIPAILREKGITVNSRILEPEEMPEYLIDKLEEEVREFVKDRSLIEIADIYEVLESIGRHFNFSQSAIEEAKLSKRNTHGGFEGRIYLEQTTE